MMRNILHSKNILTICLVFALIISITINLLLFTTENSYALTSNTHDTTVVELRNNSINYFSDNDSLVFSNANSRESYFTIHNIKKAYDFGKGKGIKVGILDWGFGFDEHKELYAGYESFNGV